MSDDNQTRFRFKCEGIDVELVGDGPFVEDMYRRIMRDIDEAREMSRPDLPDKSPESAPSEAASAGDSETAEPIVWVIRCSDMMRRVYMIEPADFRQSPLHNFLDSKAIESLYIDRGTMEQILPQLVDQNRTLWAELTESGHDKITNSDTT